MKEIFEGVFREGKALYTSDLIDRSDSLFDPARSKLAAAIMNGLSKSPIKSGSKILYLGASTGTTISHISDIVGKNGVVYAVEFADRVFQPLIELSKKRRNIVPIFADARKPEKYIWIEEADIVYVDIAQPDETNIAMRNSKEFLKKEGFVMIAIKSQSIDVTKQPEEIYEQEKKKLEEEKFSVLELINLEPYEEKHAMIIAKKK